MPGYRYTHVVTFDETNLVGNVYFAHYLHWQGHCREHFLFDHAPGVVAAIADQALAMVTVACAMEYHEEAFARDEIVVAMTPEHQAGHRLSMRFAFRRDEQLIATGTQTVACLARSAVGLRPVPVPEELSAAVRLFV